VRASIARDDEALGASADALQARPAASLARALLQRISKQSGSSGSHGSSNTIPPRAEPAAAGAPPPLEPVGVARALFEIDTRAGFRPSEPVAEAPGARIVCVAVDRGAPVVAGDVGPPIEDIAGARAIVEVGAPIVRIAAIPTAACVEAPIAGTDDGELVAMPMVVLAAETIA
jgi:hypothetical protein